MTHMRKNRLAWVVIYDFPTILARPVGLVYVVLCCALNANGPAIHIQASKCRSSWVSCETEQSQFANDDIIGRSPLFAGCK